MQLCKVRWDACTGHPSALRGVVDCAPSPSTVNLHLRAMYSGPFVHPEQLFFPHLHSLDQKVVEV